MKKIIFIGNARDYHAMDWYRTILKLRNGRNVFFATDLIHSEGHTCIVKHSDHILHLFNIDHFLLKRQSKQGNIWRNFIKLIFSIIQVNRIKSIAKRNPDAIFHAHTMYYMFLCWMAKISFIATPQGSEILVRPNRSKLYKWFAVKSLMAARSILVDSDSLKNAIQKLCNKHSYVIQNGIDIASISAMSSEIEDRTHITSIRGLAPIYRIDEIIEERNRLSHEMALSFIYPFWDINYKSNCFSKLNEADLDLGRLNKKDMYLHLSRSLLAISIPTSDSSPRSVYESIFSGCCVAVTYNRWIESLPECMKSRLYLVDINNPGWLEKAVAHAKMVTANPYRPSPEAIEMFDQNKTMHRVLKQFYN